MPHEAPLVPLTIWLVPLARTVDMFFLTGATSLPTRRTPRVDDQPPPSPPIRHRPHRRLPADPRRRALRGRRLDGADAAVRPGLARHVPDHCHRRLVRRAGRRRPPGTGHHDRDRRGSADVADRLDGRERRRRHRRHPARPQHPERRRRRIRAGRCRRRAATRRDRGRAVSPPQPADDRLPGRRGQLCPP